MDLVEHGRLDDRRHGGEDLVGLGLQPTGARLLPVEAHTAGVDGLREEGVDRPNGPVGAGTRAVAVGVEPDGDGLDAHWAGSRVALLKQAKNQSDGLGLYGVDDELLLRPSAALLDFDRCVAEGRPCSVPEALARVLFHGAEDVLGVLLRLVLVEQRDHLAHHHLRRIVAELLGDGDQLDAVLGELAQVELEPERVAEEARERVHDNDVEGVLAVAGALDHALELTPLVVGRRGAGLDVLGGDAPAALADPGLRLRLLVRDRQVVLGLAAGRDAQVDRGARRRCRQRAGVRSGGSASCPSGSGHAAALLSPVAISPPDTTG